MRPSFQFEREARYWEFIASQPFNNPNILDDDFKRRTMYLSGWKLSTSLPGVVEQILSEVAHDYRMAVKQSIVDAMFQKPELNRLLTAQNVQAHQG